MSVLMINTHVLNRCAMVGAAMFSVFLFCVPKHLLYAAPGDITAVRIDEGGWYAEVDIEGFVDGGTYNYGIGLSEDGNFETVDNNPANAKMVFTVTSQGYNANGQLGTVTRTVYGTKFVRKPYPDNDINNRSVADEVESGGTLTIKVALSDFIYDDDESGAGKSGTDITVDIASGLYTDSGTGGSGSPNGAVDDFFVTNNSALDYPKVIGRWAWPGYERVTDDFLVEVTAFHHFGRNGKPVAAIVFQASDQSGNSSYATTTNMTVTSRSGDANTVLVYAATMDIGVLDQGEVIDVNFNAYPWVGDENSVLNSRTTADGYVQPQERLGPLHLLNDKNGTYGIGYAYVNRSTGDDSTGTVYASQAAAEGGNAYLTIRAAATGIKNYHNSNYSRNSAGGGIILLAEGNHPYAGGTQPNPDLGTSMDTWLIVKPATGASRASTKISSGGAAIRAARLKFEGVTLEPSVASGGGLTGRATDVLWLHNNVINGTSSFPIYLWRDGYATQNNVTALTNGFDGTLGTARGPFSLIRGNNSTPIIHGHFYTTLGNKNITPDHFVEGGSGQQLNAGLTVPKNAIYAFNSIYNQSTDIQIVTAATTTSDIAIVQNLFERVAGDLLGAMSLNSSSGGIGTSTNYIIWHNTFAGERQQWGYNSENSVSDRKVWSQKFNMQTEQAYKTDTFIGDNGANGIRTGNWPLVYGVGHIGNKSIERSFEGDFLGLFAQWGPSGGKFWPGFVNDASKETGSNTGNGNYSLTATSTAIDVVVSTSDLYNVLPYDFLGNPRYGSSDTGAYEYQPPYTMGVHLVSTTSPIRIYGDEKFRVKNATTTPAAADISITIPGTDRSQWLDFTATSTWYTSGTYRKAWLESSSTTALSNIVHTIGGFAADNNYTVTVDGSTSNIVGDNCTAGVCRSSGSGYITFTYTGSYSDHYFDVYDNSAPTILSISSDTANGTYTLGDVIDIDLIFSESVTATSSITVTLDTGQTCTFTVSNSTTASCNYTVVANDSSADLTVSSVSGYMEDSAGNVMVNFTPATNLGANKAIVIDTGTPVLSAGSPSGEQVAGTTEVTISLTTNEAAFCKYGTTGGVAFASMSSTFSATSTSHATTVSGLTDGASYTYYVRCQDAGGNTNTSDFTISFSIAESSGGGSPSGGGGGGGGSTPPAPKAPVNGFSATADVVTTNNQATLHFVFGDDVTRVVISENAYFVPAVYIPATSSLSWNFASAHMVYVKYCNTYGKCSDPVAVKMKESGEGAHDSKSNGSTHVFTVPLRIGMKHADIKKLQEILNMDKDTKLAESGIGSPGQETDYFGLLTEDAVKRFQIKHGIASAGPVETVGYGDVGPHTREKLNELFGNKIATSSEVAQVMPNRVLFTKNLMLGDSGREVFQLQQYLNANGFLISTNGPGSPGQETDYFGTRTYLALVKFQEAYAEDVLIPAGLTRATGYFGPSTRMFINNK